MYIKEWLANQTHVATSVFHLGRYCDDWKASTYPTGMPSFHLVLEGQCWLRFTDRITVVNLSEGDIVFFFFNMPFYLAAVALRIKDCKERTNSSPPLLPR